MNRTFIRRINKEIEQVNNNLNFKYSYAINEYLNNVKCTINSIEYYQNQKYYLQILYYNNFYFELCLPIDYPFHPYTMYKHKLSNYVGYNNYISNLSKNIILYNENILEFFYITNFCLKPKFINTKSKCYCCTSILCFHNWFVSSKLIDLLFEFHEIEYIDNILKNTDQYKKIIEIYNDTYFNKLPYDILKHICSFMI